LLIEVTSDEQLIALLASPGFLLNVDYPTRNVKLHSIRCKYCDPRRKIGVKPSSKSLNKTGEFWYSASYKEAASKAIEIAETRGYKYQICPLCNP
jgi:hypothetical protein